jgi:hypothetical protein
LRRNKKLFTKIQNTNRSKHAHNSVFFIGLQKDNEGKTKRKPIDLKTISYETKNKNPTILDKEDVISQNLINKRILIKLVLLKFNWKLN